MVVPLETRIDVGEVVDLTRALVRINTVNPPGNEAEGMRVLGEYLAGHRIEFEYQDVAPGRANLIARLPGRNRTGHLVLSGHMDVVPVGETTWAHDPFAADLVDGRIVGRGAADMKGGVAAMAVALVTLAEAGFQPEADLILAVSCSEENLGLGAQHMVQTRILEGSSYLVIGEPTGLNVCPVEKGGRIWMLVIRGKAAHSSTPHLGVNAIAVAARAALAFEANPFPYTEHDLVRKPTVTVAGIQSWPPNNVVPEECRLAVAIRTVPGQTDEMLDTRLQEVLAEVTADSGLDAHAEIESVRGIPPIDTPVDHPLVRFMLDAARDAGAHPALVGFTGGTDAAKLAPGFDMPFVIFGPGGLDQAHQVNEYVDVAELGTAARAYVGIAQRLLGSTG